MRPGYRQPVPGGPARRRSLRLLLGFLLLFVVVLLGLTQAQAVGDWWRLRNYVPPAKVSQLADQTSMSDLGRHLFYLNHPGVESKADFRKACPDYGEKTIVLGCYKSVQNGIHVLAVDDERLSGVEQVTAAHEMLHAAYDRLKPGEKTKLDQALQAYASSGLVDERIKKTLEGYRTTEPGQEYNEMHSIFGTEIASLPPELEAHYRQYFTDRKKVTTYAAQYQDAFTSRKDEVARYDAMLADQSKQIKANLARLDDQEKQINSEESRMVSLRSQGRYAEYNANVNSFNALVDNYNGLIATTKQLIESYNQLVEQRNAIAAETTELQQAIDSSVVPAGQ